MTHFRYLIPSLLALGLCLSPPVSAQESADDIVDHVIEGYGGKKFEKMKSLSITSDLRFGWIGQGNSPDFVTLEPMTKIYTFDFAKKYASEEAWGQAGSYSEKVMFKDGEQTTIDYMNGTYAVESDAGYYDHFGGEIRSSDTMLAYELMNARESAVNKGDRLYLGEPHYVVEFDMQGTDIDPVLWINKETGHISRAVRDIPNYNVISYVFGDFKSGSGISYADSFELYIGDRLIEYMKSRSVRVNKAKASNWTVGKAFRARPDAPDNSEMTVNEITAGVFHVGQNNAYSAFVEDGESVIAIGGYGGLKDRYDAYVEAQGAKPLKYLILTHHHTDHIGGAAEALEMGAKIVLPAATRRALLGELETAPTDEQLIIISEPSKMIGPIQIDIVDTAHALDYAITSIPAAKVVFEADHYSNQFANGLSYVGRNGVSLKQQIDRLGLPVDTLLSAHNSQPVDYSAFSEKADEFVPGLCPTGRKICKDMK